MSLIRKLEAIRVQRAAQFDPISLDILPSVDATLSTHVREPNAFHDAYLYRIGFQLWVAVHIKENELEEARKQALLALHHALFEEFRGQIAELRLAILSSERRRALQLATDLYDATYGVEHD